MVTEIKLICVIMGGDHENFLEIAINSAKTADKIIYVDGGSTDNSVELAESKGVEVLTYYYDHEDKDMNGKQRNRYLTYLKENHMNEWVLCIDADEVIDDLSKIREFLKYRMPMYDDEVLYSVKMRHLMYNFSHEDSTKKDHMVQNRLFKVRKDLSYPLGEHVFLTCGNKDFKAGNTSCTTIWHLAYARMFHIRSRNRKNLRQSNVHSPLFLREWYFKHLFGSYPVSRFNPVELPQVLLQAFDIDKDELYFMDRQIEAKHGPMVKTWYDHFELTECDMVVCLGCGRGPFVYYWEWLCNVLGIELSKWAVDNSFSSWVQQGDITDFDYVDGFAELITMIDVLEHLKPEDLDKTLDYWVGKSEHILVSVPFIGDPNLSNDPTHLIHRSRAWWVKQFTSKGCKEVEVPMHFQYREQLMIFKVVEE